MAIPIWIRFFISCLLIFGTTVVVRIWTGAKRGSSAPRGTAVPVLPYWVPWVGHSFVFSNDPLSVLAKVSRIANSNHGILAVMIRREKHNIISSQSIVQQILSSSSFSRIEARLHIFRTFFDGGSFAKLTLEQQNDILEYAYGLKNESGLSSSICKFIRLLEGRTFNLISFSDSWIDQSSWERAAETSVVDSPNTAVEASFFALVGTFVGEIATELLMGHNFIEDHPTFLEDLGSWNSKTIPFLLGRSKWLPTMSVAAIARRRILDAVEKFQDRLLKSMSDKDLGMDESDMSDVSQIMINRIIAWKESKAPLQARVSGDATLLWAVQKPTNPICWLLYRIYSDTKLLKSIRKETETFVIIEHQKSDLPVQEPPQVSIDMDGLMTRCPSLKSSMYETLRLDTNSITYGKTTNEVLVTESQEDAIRKGRPQPESYKLPKGELVCIPHCAYHKDPRFWERAEVFDPSRFLARDEKETGKISVNTDALHVFGAGLSMCPGMDFAEREIMAAAAITLAMWDMVPVKGKWAWPGQKVVGMSAVPLKDVRVKISRRVAGMGY